MKTFSWRPAVEDFAGPLVEHFLIRSELLIGDSGEVETFGQVMANAVVLAFAGGALPRAMGVAEEDLELEFIRELGVFGHFFALVVSEGATQPVGQRGELAGERFADARGVLGGKVAKDDVAGLALDEHADGGAITGPENEVPLVVAGDQAGFDFGRAVIDQHHVLELALGRRDAPPTGLPMAMVPSQTSHEFPFEFTARQDVNVAVDRFMGGVHGRGSWVVLAQAERNLFGRPTAAQPGSNGGLQGRIGHDRTEAAPRPPRCAQRRPGRRRWPGRRRDPRQARSRD